MNKYKDKLPTSPKLEHIMGNNISNEIIDVIECVIQQMVRRGIYIHWIQCIQIQRIARLL